MPKSTKASRGSGKRSKGVKGSPTGDPAVFDGETADVLPEFAPFSHALAFSRTLGVLTLREQRRFARTRVAIAGVGGAGSAHALALARSGVGLFNVADLDQYEVGNFNRQMGATMSNVGRDKVIVMSEMMADINPTAKLTLFERGINEENIDEFLTDVDVAVDSIDFFAPRARRLLYQAARRRGITVVLAVPIGLGCTALVFSPTGMSFDEYTGITDDCDEVEMCTRFLVAVLPKVLHKPGNVEPWRLNIAMRRAPSHVTGIFMTAAAVANEVLKIVTGRGKSIVVPDALQIDLFTTRLVRTHGANKALYRRFRANHVLKQMRKSLALSEALAEPTDIEDDLQYILEAARWAPSMNNRQGWRFTRLSPVRVRIALSVPSGFVAGERNHALVLQELGGLLEVARVAASERVRRPWYRIEPVEQGATSVSVEVLFRPASRTTDGPDGFLTLPETEYDAELFTYLRRRRTNRAPFLRTELFQDVVEEIVEIAEPLGVEVVVHSSRASIAAVAKANLLAAKVVRAHNGPLDPTLVIDEEAPTVGVPRRGLAPTGLFAKNAETQCASHLTMSLAKGTSWSTDAVVRGGAALVRIWLVCTSHYVEVQPSCAAVSLAWAVADGTDVKSSSAAAAKVAAALRDAWSTTGVDATRALLTLRVGRVTAEPTVRATRMPVDQLFAK